MTWERATICAEPVLEFDDILLEIECLRVRRGGRLVHLGSIEFGILVALLENPSKVWTRAALVERVWGQQATVDRRVVDVHVAVCARRLVKLTTNIRSEPCGVSATHSANVAMLQSGRQNRNTRRLRHSSGPFSKS